MDQDDCINLGCCWDENSPGNPWCYKEGVSTDAQPYTRGIILILYYYTYIIFFVKK